MYFHNNLKECTMKNTISRRSVLKRGSVAVAGLSITHSLASPDANAAQEAVIETPVEWRNRQPGMAYRRLGRTGYMVSEIVMGGNTISPKNNKHVEMAVEMGLNYFDTPPAYGGGNSEIGHGEIIKKSSIREKV